MIHRIPGRSKGIKPNAPKRYIKYYKDAFKNSKKFIPLAITKLLAEDISEVLNIDFNDILILPSAVNINKFGANKIVSSNDEKKLNITYAQNY